MILITGAAGLVGKTLVAHLAPTGIPIKAAYCNTALPNFNSKNVLPIKLDILDVAALQAAMIGVTQVYHCAGLVSFAPSDAAQLFKINVEGTANVVNACLLASVAKLVHVSSVAALGRVANGLSINEAMQWTPETSNSQYGHSKYLGEMEVWRGHAEGLHMVIVNPAIILGIGNWNEGSTKLFKTIYNGFKWYTTGTTGFVLAVDVAKAMVHLMDSNINGERFIVSENNYSYQYILNCIATSFNTPKPHKKVTPFIAACTWRVEKIKAFFTNNKPLITKETAANSLAYISFNNLKLLKALPNFKYSNMQEGIANICKALVI